MKFSYSWLRELIDGLNESPQEMMHLITLKTAECEGLEEVGALFKDASEARIESFWSTQGYRWFVVETEKYGRKQVMCKAPNAGLGLRTVYVPIGIKEFGGSLSDGMLASASELGINRDHSG